MIQRRQSLEWLLAGIALLVYGVLHGADVKMFSSLYLPSLLCFITIFAFKNRKLQIQLNRWNLWITLTCWVLIIIEMFKLEGKLDFFTMIRPAVPIFLIWMGGKNTQKDEDKVRSIDRIR